MALESANTILDLNPSWPTSGDDVSDGDNHIRMIKDVLQTAYPVGAIIINKHGANPSTYIGGTWAQVAQGRAIVGVGNNGESDWLAGDQRGSETHTLTVDELPAHKHTTPDGTTAEAGSHTHDFTYDGIETRDQNQLGDGFRYNYAFNKAGVTAAAGAHTHAVTIPESNETGADQPHNNLQPSEAYYVWERTA